MPRAIPLLGVVIAACATNANPVGRWPAALSGTYEFEGTVGSGVNSEVVVGKITFRADRTYRIDARSTYCVDELKRPPREQTITFECRGARYEFLIRGDHFDPRGYVWLAVDDVQLTPTRATRTQGRVYTTTRRGALVVRRG